MLIDTNILVYAINADSSKNIRAQEFLNKNNTNLEVAHQNIFEAIRVLTHPKFQKPLISKLAVDAVLSIAQTCRIIIPNYKTHYLALDLIQEYNLTGNHIFDAYLAATAITNDITTVATDNIKDFTPFRIHVINPF